MRTGKRVEYVSARGDVSDADVLAIVGVGPSWYKLLDLRVGGRTYRSVAHELDVAGGAYWREHAAPEPEDRDNVPAPVVPVIPPAGRATAGVGDTTEEVWTDST